MDEKKKSGFAALVGRPNVGKSTLMNHLIGQKIAITSDKPQTTRNRIQTVYTDERGQVIFLDTPGIHKAKNKLGEYMVSVAEGTLSEVDVILWLVEPTTYIGAGEQHIAGLLRKVKTPVILVINKIDTVKQPEEILTFINAYKDICDFAEIVPVSALKDKNTDVMMEQIFKYLPYGPQYYDEDTVTDQPMRQIAAEPFQKRPVIFLIRFRTGRVRAVIAPPGIVDADQDGNKIRFHGKKILLVPCQQIAGTVSRYSPVDEFRAASRIQAAVNFGHLRRIPRPQIICCSVPVTVRDGIPLK